MREMNGPAGNQSLWRAMPIRNAHDSKTAGLRLLVVYE